MNAGSSIRPRPVWVALSLQIALIATATYSSVHALAFWWQNTGAHIHGQLIVREVIPVVLAAVSIVGLWSNRRWGWITALIADGMMCADTLWTISSLPIVIRSLRFFAFSVWEFAAVASLLYLPVREHFLGRRPNPMAATVVPAEVRDTRSWFRVVVYFLVAVVGTCAVTAFFLALSMKQKNEFSQDFLLFVYVGIVSGSGASFLFVLFLTAAARKFGPARLGLWMLLGALLAPCLIVALGLIGTRFQDPLFLLFGPTALWGAGWWLTPFIGAAIGWLCYLMYPWAYSIGRHTPAIPES